MKLSEILKCIPKGEDSRHYINCFHQFKRVKSENVILSPVLPLVTDGIIFASMYNQTVNFAYLQGDGVIAFRFVHPLRSKHIKKVNKLKVKIECDTVKRRYFTQNKEELLKFKKRFKNIMIKIYNDEY